MQMKEIQKLEFANKVQKDIINALRFEIELLKKKMEIPKSIHSRKAEFQVIHKNQKKTKSA